jgi:hypothetical protein
MRQKPMLLVKVIAKVIMFLLLNDIYLLANLQILDTKYKNFPELKNRNFACRKTSEISVLK